MQWNVIKLFFAKVWLEITSSFTRSYKQVEILVVPVGWLSIVAYPLYYWIWTYKFPQQYDSMTMRGIGVLLSIGLVLKHHWPESLKKYQPVQYYIAAIYGLSFQSNFLLFHNPVAIPALITLFMLLFLLVFLFEWIVFNILFFIGFFAAIIVYKIQTGLYPDLALYAPYMPLYLFTVVAASIFSYRTIQLRERMLEGMAAAGANIAHELRTPLLGIKSGSVGLGKYLPLVFQGYELAKQHHLPVPEIRPTQYDALLPTVKRIQSEVDYANTMIDMLLINVNKKHQNERTMGYHSMRECIQTALARYPFSSSGLGLDIIHYSDKEVDFVFYGSDVLMMHVLFNLIKNALYFIATANKGQIYIILEPGKDYNRLHIKDTGRGVTAKEMPNLFTSFYTTTEVGTGVGLAFCKSVVELFKGKIHCESVYGEYADFIIDLPVVKEKLN